MKRILIVEDNEKSICLARIILEEEGYEVIEAKGGTRARVWGLPFPRDWWRCMVA